MAISNADMLAMARQLPIPVPWDRDVFIDNLSELRGRPIRLFRPTLRRWPIVHADLAGSR